MKISFDFDDTLDKLFVQNMAKIYIEKGHDVYITSQRVINDVWNKDIYMVANELGIPEENIRIIGESSKSAYLLDFDLYFDDDFMELVDIHKKLIV